MSSKKDVSRRSFLAASAASATAWTMPEAARAAVQTSGVKPNDLAIKEVKVYVLRPRSDTGASRAEQQLASIVTNSGIEGNYTLANRYFHPNWSNLGWLDYAKRLLAGKSALDLPALTSQWAPAHDGVGQTSYASAIDNCLWDILGQGRRSPGVPHSGRVQEQGAGVRQLSAPEDGGRLCRGSGARQEGRLHGVQDPPALAPNNTVDYKLDIEVAKAVRKAAGDDYPLLYDRVGAYTRDEAIKVGRVLRRAALRRLRRPAYRRRTSTALRSCPRPWTCPSPLASSSSRLYDYAAVHPPRVLRRGAVHRGQHRRDHRRDEGRPPGGVFGMECRPHNWGTALDHAVHFHCELAMPNNMWFEMTQPQGISDRPYFKDLIRIDKDGYVPAPTKPGLGYEIDRDAMDKMMVRIDR